jgi:hypothetical protein
VILKHALKKAYSAAVYFRKRATGAPIPEPDAVTKLEWAAAIDHLATLVRRGVGARTRPAQESAAAILYSATSMPVELDHCARLMNATTTALTKPKRGVR